MPVQYGYGNKVHEGLKQLFDQGHSLYKMWLTRMVSFENQFCLMADKKSAFPVALVNGATPAIDLFALYTFLAHIRPKRFLEIGSGHSTTCAVNTIRTEGLPTTITIVDPAAGLWDAPEVTLIYRNCVHEVPLSTFDLSPGDILYVDGSHVATMGSDVVTVFLEVLPKLSAGVFVHFHDIFLPMDYWPHWEPNKLSEQYLLAVLLLFSPDRFRIHLPVRYCCEDPSMIDILDPLCSVMPWLNKDTGMIGGSFWMESL